MGLLVVCVLDGLNWCILLWQMLRPSTIYSTRIVCIPSESCKWVISPVIFFLVILLIFFLNRGGFSFEFLFKIHYTPNHQELFNLIFDYWLSLCQIFQSNISICSNLIVLSSLLVNVNAQITQKKREKRIQVDRRSHK